MKIETEIPDISRDEILDAIARNVLTQVGYDYDDGGAGRVRSPLARQLKEHIDGHIEKLAEALVREQFDAVIKDRIAKTVDDVLAEGWQKTNSYGEPMGTKLTLKERIAEVLHQRKDSYSRETLIDGKIKEAVEAALGKEFQTDIAVAKSKVRAELDAVMSGKVAEALKSAMGLR